jgi:hypothetical protein
MRRSRLMVPVVSAALLVLLPDVAMASTTYADRVVGIEYAATSTVGRFAGAAAGPLPGGWDARIVHGLLRAGQNVPITGGTFTLHTRSAISGVFTGGSVSSIDAPATCSKERFTVTGTMALNGGGSASVAVVLTHLRARLGTRCVTSGATVVGRMTLAPGFPVTA